MGAGRRHHPLCETCGHGDQTTPREVGTVSHVDPVARDPTTEAGQHLCAALASESAETLLSWADHDQIAGLVGVMFTLFARRRFGRRPDLPEVSRYVIDKWRDSPDLDPLAAEATIRFALDQIYVTRGLPDEALLTSTRALLLPLSRDLQLSRQEIRRLTAEAEDMLSQIVQTPLYTEIVDSASNGDRNGKQEK